MSSIKNISTIILLVALSACGASGDHAPEYDIAPEAQSYVEEFYAAAKTENIPVQKSDLIVKMGVLASANEAGLCEYSQTPTITLDKANWQIADDSMRRAIVAHELGHCLLNRSHLNSVMTMTWPDMISWSTTQPASAMNPIAGNIHMGDIGNMKQFYYHELFHPSVN